MLISRIQKIRETLKLRIVSPTHPPPVERRRQLPEVLLLELTVKAGHSFNFSSDGEIERDTV